MKLLFMRDGVSLHVDHDGVMWLAVRDGNGSHSTTLTEEGARMLAEVLLGCTGPQPRRVSE